MTIAYPALLLVACNSAVIDDGRGIERIEGNGTLDTGAPGGETADAVYEAFFDPTVIQTVDIVLSDEVIGRLNRGLDDGYEVGDVTINGRFFPSAGVRLKGSSTFEDLNCDDGLCKGAFKIKLNEFGTGQRYGGLERITLNNMTSDLTQSKEVIVYDILNQNSQLASRCSYARVTLNGEPWGLYANVESADEHWLKRRFSDPSGNLWGTASSWGDFDTRYLDTGWVSKSGDGDKSLLQAVTAALDTYGGDFFGELGPLIDTDQWLQYWGWCAATGNFDGYPFVINDVLLYSDPADDNRFVFAPWGTDESWDEVEYSGRAWNVVSARLGLACLGDPACLAELKTHIGEAVMAYDATDVMGMAQAAWDLSEADVLTDPKRPFTPAEVWANRDYFAGVMADYGEYVLHQLDP